MLCLKPTAYESKSLSKNNTGLGNVLFQLSTIYSICKEHKIIFNSFYFKKFIEKLNNFNLCHDKTIFRNINLDNENSKFDVKLNEENSHIYSDNLINNIIKNKNKSILIENSYLQSTKYYIKYEKDIQNLFEPTNNFIDQTLEKYPDIFLDEINIAIHLRYEWGIKIDFNLDFIKKSIDIFKKNCNNSKIRLWIFSDNLTKAKNFLSNIDFNIIFVKNDFDYEDLWMMSLCKYHILCFSTFSWWGAFLSKYNDKKIIYSSDFAEYFCKKVLRKTYSVNDIQDNIFPKNWVCLKDKYILM